MIRLWELFLRVYRFLFFMNIGNNDTPGTTKALAKTSTKVTTTASSTPVTTTPPTTTGGYTITPSGFPPLTTTVGLPPPPPPLTTSHGTPSLVTTSPQFLGPPIGFSTSGLSTSAPPGGAMTTTSMATHTLVTPSPFPSCYATASLGEHYRQLLSSRGDVNVTDGSQSVKTAWVYHLKKDELRAELMKRNLDDSGRARELRARLVEALRTPAVTPTEQEVRGITTNNSDSWLPDSRDLGDSTVNGRFGLPPGRNEILEYISEIIGLPPGT